MSLTLYIQTLKDTVCILLELYTPVIIDWIPLCTWLQQADLSCCLASSISDLFLLNSQKPASEEK